MAFATVLAVIIKSEKEKQMYYLGVAYYPELWEKSEIEKDVIRMKSVGINCVRVGEFAWGEMEKREGEYDFSLFKYMLDVMYENGIYTVLCTPSATPPRWVFEKHPDAIRVRSEGFRKVQLEHNARVHSCKSHKGIRYENSRIAEKMAEALGKHPGVIGWQIDNEIYPYDYGCYCDNCIKEFREYLKKKYGTIENLNKKWVMHRWSLDYDNFDQIKPPSDGTWEHPSRQTEWLFFQNELIYSYVKEQADAIRKHSSAPIGTDMMNIEGLLSYAKMNSFLDVVQHNHYNEQKDLYKSLFFYDFVRTLKDRPFWITETQPGWNGSVGAYGGYRESGHNYMNSLAPIAKGAEMNLYWLYRSHKAGHELGHGALFSSSGRENSVAGATKRLSQDLEKARDFLDSTKVKSKIALTYSSTAVVNLRYVPTVAYLDRNVEERLIESFYDAFRHHNIDVIETDKALDGYEVLISPMVTSIEENGFKDKALEFVKNGGTWIVGPLSDIMTEYAAKYENAPYSSLEEICGVYTKYQVPVEEKSYTAKLTDGTEFNISLGCDAYELRGAECVATYESVPDLGGLCAIARNKVGKGEVILLGTAPSKDVLLRLVNKAPNAKASSNISVIKREGEQNGLIALELENKEGYIELDGKYYDILNEKEVTGRVEMKPFEALFLRFEEKKL